MTSPEFFSVYRLDSPPPKLIRKSGRQINASTGRQYKCILKFSKVLLSLTGTAAGCSAGCVVGCSGWSEPWKGSSPFCAICCRAEPFCNAITSDRAAKFLSWAALSSCCRVCMEGDGAAWLGPAGSAVALGSAGLSPPSACGSFAGQV